MTLFLASSKNTSLREKRSRSDLYPDKDESSYVNGQNIAVDGGLSSSHPVVPGRWA